MRVYISGPMSGIPQFNAPAFDLVAAHYQDRGYEVVNPIALDDLWGYPEGVELEDGEWLEAHKHQLFMKRDLPLVAECDGIVMLNGWFGSRGANAELFVARACGLWEDHVLVYQGQVFDVPPLTLVLNFELLREVAAP